MEDGSPGRLLSLSICYIVLESLNLHFEILPSVSDQRASQTLRCRDLHDVSLT